MDDVVFPVRVVFDSLQTVERACVDGLLPHALRASLACVFAGSTSGRAILRWFGPMAWNEGQTDYSIVWFGNQTTPGRRTR